MSDSTEESDLVIRGGRVVDGTRMPAFIDDIAVKVRSYRQRLRFRWLRKVGAQAKYNLRARVSTADSVAVDTSNSLCLITRIVAVEESS